MVKEKKKKQNKPSSYNTLDVLLVVSGIVFVSLTIFSVVSSSNQSQQVPTQTKEQETTSRIKQELENKPLSTVCAEYKAQLVFLFSNCPQGKERLSSNQDNPLFYCCR